MKIIAIILASLVLSSCQNKHEEKTSPCVSLGNTDGPCERFPINIATYNDEQEKNA